MSKRWYPVIDYDKCINCGQCIEKCKRNVYKRENNEKPIVVNPENCSEGCEGCKIKCPVGAIEYIDTRKENYNEKESNIGDSCSCGCSGNCRNMDNKE